MAYRVALRVLLYPEGGSWVAHCLEFDLVGAGAQQDEALQQLAGAIETQVAWSVEQGDPSLLFSPAPREVEVLFAAGQDIEICAATLDLRGLPSSLDYVFESARLRVHTVPRVDALTIAAS